MPDIIIAIIPDIIIAIINVVTEVHNQRMCHKMKHYFCKRGVQKWKDFAVKIIDKTAHTQEGCKF